MRAYSNTLKAGVLGLAMLTAAPAFSCSAQAGPAPSVDIAALQQDPVHQAAIKASANKIVFVLGEGFGRRASMALKNRLNEIGLSEGKHYQFIEGAASPQQSCVVYVGGDLIRDQSTNKPLVFEQYSASDAVVAIEKLINGGIITVAALKASGP